VTYVALKTTLEIRLGNCSPGVANLSHAMRQIFETWVEMRHTVGYFL